MIRIIHESYIHFALFFLNFVSSIAHFPEYQDHVNDESYFENKVITVKEITRNIDKYYGKEVLVEGYLRNVCEIQNTNYCSKKYRGSRYVIFGDLVSTRKEKMQICNSEGNYEILIKERLPDYLSKKIGKRVILHGVIERFEESFPKKDRSNSSLKIKWNYNFRLKETKIVHKFESYCSY